MQVEIFVNDKALKLALAALGNNAPRAGARALNLALRAVRTRAGRNVQRDFEIKTRDLRKDTLKEEPARPGKLEARLRVSGQRIPISQFGRPAETRKGVTVTIRKGAGRQLFSRSFMATSIRGTGIEVFWRKKLSSGKLVPRHPLQLLLGPSVVQIVAAPKRLKELLAFGDESVRKNLRSQISRFTKV